MDDLIKDLRKINDEVERAYHSWSIFWQSKREMEPQYDDLIAAFDSRKIGPTVNHVQMVLLHDCVATICRVTDQNWPDRVTIDSVMLQLRPIHKDRRADELKAVEEKRKAVIKHNSLAELRVFRNSEIGHSLRQEPPATAYHSIPVLIDQLFDFLDATFKLCGDARWIGQMTTKKMNSLASEFWNCVELGAQIRSDRSTNG